MGVSIIECDLPCLGLQRFHPTEKRPRQFTMRTFDDHDVFAEDWGTVADITCTNYGRFNNKEGFFSLGFFDGLEEGRSLSEDEKH